MITLKSKTVEAAFKLNSDAARMCLRPGLQIQLLPSLRDIKSAQKHQCAAFIQEESYILVWDDNPERLLQHAAELEHQLVKIAWHNATGTYTKNDLSQFSEPKVRDLLLDLGADTRHPTYINSIISACTLALSLLVVGLGMKVIAEEIALDHNYTRLAALLFTPIQFLLSLVGHSIFYFSPFKDTDVNSSFSCRLSLYAFSSCLDPLDNARQIPNITRPNHRPGQRGMSYSHILPSNAPFSWRVSRP